MNIFFLDKDPYISAQKQVSKSLVKMCLETTQLLSTALRENGCEDEELYKATHKNHPSSKWTRRTTGNFEYLLEHALGLFEEYTKRYGKIHKCQSKVEHIISNINYHAYIPKGGFSVHEVDLAIKSTEAGLTALQRYQKSAQTLDDFVEAYQSFYEAKDYVKASR